jgi:predicted nucleotidyltransferase
MDKTLEGLVTRLKSDAGANLRSVVLYGSAASGEFHVKHSDLNVLCLLHRIDPADLERLHKAAAWFVRKGHPMPLVFSVEELRNAADLYAIELLEIKMHRRVLFGEDVFGSIDVPMTLHRTQVERDLRHQLIRLRQGYIALAGRKKAVFALMTQSLSSFALLFRHALIVLGESPSSSKWDAVQRLAALLGLDSSGLKLVFELRDYGPKQKELDQTQAFGKYLGAVTEAVNAIDRKFEELDR